MMMIKEFYTDHICDKEPAKTTYNMTFATIADFPHSFITIVVASKFSIAVVRTSWGGKILVRVSKGVCVSNPSFLVLKYFRAGGSTVTVSLSG